MHSKFKHEGLSQVYVEAKKRGYECLYGSMCRQIRCHIKEKKVVKFVPKSKWKPDLVTYPGEKVQIDIKYVPRESLDFSTQGKSYYQLTAIDEFSRKRILKIIDEKSVTNTSDMYPLYWTTSKGGILMRYSYEFKRKAIELFYQGEWVKLEQLHGPDINKFRVANKSWSPEEKYKLVCQVLSGQALSAIAIIAGINSGQLYQWVHKYKTLGYNGLINKPKGRPSKDCKMKVTKTISPRKLKESEYEELIRLRAEIAYIKAENEVIKKEIALREEKEAARLKAKKQRLSKHSESKDIN